MDLLPTPAIHKLKEVQSLNLKRYKGGAIMMGLVPL